MREAQQQAAAGFAARDPSGAPHGAEVHFVLSPYRICPLGAHVDHQDGVVTGMAIDQGVVVAFAPRGDAHVRAASAGFSGETTFDLANVPPPPTGDWGNFLRGAAAALQRQHRLPRGVAL